MIRFLPPLDAKKVVKIHRIIGIIAFICMYIFLQINYQMFKSTLGQSWFAFHVIGATTSMYVGRMDLTSWKGRLSKSLYQIWMLFVWGMSTTLSMILLMQSLSDRKNVDIFKFDLVYILPGVVYTTINIISHAVLIFYSFNDNLYQEEIRELPRIGLKLVRYIGIMIPVVGCAYFFLIKIVPTKMIFCLLSILLLICSPVLCVCGRYYPCNSKCIGLIGRSKNRFAHTLIECTHIDEKAGCRIVGVLTLFFLTIVTAIYIDVKIGTTYTFIDPTTESLPEYDIISIFIYSFSFVHYSFLCSQCHPERERMLAERRKMLLTDLMESEHVMEVEAL